MVIGVQRASNFGETVLKIVEKKAAAINPSGNKHHGQQPVQCGSGGHIADGRKQGTKKKNPGSRDSPLLLFQEPYFFVICCTINFFLIT